MHRFLLRNTANDPRTLSLRRANSGKILERPVVGGLRLAPRGSKIILIHEISEALLKDIERLSAIGNVEFLTVGKIGGVADLDAIRKVRGWGVVGPVLGQMQDTIMVDEVAVFQVDPEPLSPENLEVALKIAGMLEGPAPTIVLDTSALEALNETIEVVPESTPLPLEEEGSLSPSTEEEASGAQDAEVPATEPEPALAVEPAPPILGVADPASDGKLTREELQEFKLPELRELVVASGGKTTGKNKDALISFLLDAR